jgi:hypothetical protein
LQKLTDCHQQYYNSRREPIPAAVLNLPLLPRVPSPPRFVEKTPSRSPSCRHRYTEYPLETPHREFRDWVPRDIEGVYDYTVRRRDQPESRHHQKKSKLYKGSETTIISQDPYKSWDLAGSRKSARYTGIDYMKVAKGRDQDYLRSARYSSSPGSMAGFDRLHPKDRMNRFDRPDQYYYDDRELLRRKIYPYM